MYKHQDWVFPKYRTYYTIPTTKAQNWNNVSNLCKSHPIKCMQYMDKPFSGQLVEDEKTATFFLNGNASAQESITDNNGMCCMNKNH